MSVPFATSAPLSHPAIRHGFFGRAGGVSDGTYASLNCGPGSADTSANVAENRHRVAATLGGGTLYTVHQHHSPDCAILTGKKTRPTTPRPTPWPLTVRGCCWAY